MSLVDLIPDSDYRFQMRFEQGSVVQFFGHTDARQRLLRERQHWLATAPHTYAALLPEGAPLLREASELLAVAAAASGNEVLGSDSDLTDWDHCLALGARWEPDFLLLKAGSDSEIRLWGGCVCFPSSWNLQEKIGRPIEVIHGVVPGLNGQIGPQIHAFLSRLKPDVAWRRTNWGLSSSPELNQHPARQLPSLDGASVTAAAVWFRVEHQALVALPRTGGILFGIRVSVHPLNELKSEPIAAARLVRALRTMPEAVARYKGLATARAALIRLLEEP